MRTALYATHPILAVSVLERDARGCWSTSHRPLSCRCHGLKPDVHRARYGCRRHAWAVCSVAGASFAHTTHQIFKTLKCARDMSPLDQGEIELARARRDATVLPRPRPSQHEPAACGGGRRGDRSRRHRDPGRSDCCDDFTQTTHTCRASVYGISHIP